MGFSRRYKINSVLIRPSGVTTVIEQKSFNMLSGFTGTTIIPPFEDFAYNDISLTELAELNDTDYTFRSLHFVQYVYVISKVDYSINDVYDFIFQTQFFDPVNCS